MKTILFTQCLQNDFVAPVPSGAPLPSALHIGRAWRDVAKLENDLKLILVSLADDNALAPRPYWLAQLLYSAHAMSFEECSPRQRRLALASTCLLAARLHSFAASSSKPVLPSG